MKIIYLHQYFNTLEMSGGTRSYEMARRLVVAGHEVHMITSWRSGDGQDSAWFVTDEKGIKVHWLPVPYSNHMSYRARISAFLRFAFRSLSKARELDGDVIFATSTPLTIAIPAVFSARKKKIPMVFEVRDLWPELPIAMGALRNPVARWMAHRLERWAYNNSEAIIALSPGMKDGVVRAGYPADKVAVIPNSSDNTEFMYSQDGAARFRADREWLGEKPLLVYTGTFGAINGVGYLVSVAQELLKIGSDICILLVGDGFEKQSVMAQADKAGVLGRNLFFEEKLPKKDIPALLSAADIASSLFIDLPEMRPNSANKFFDALASGTPVLLNYGGWMHDLVKARECGLALWKCSPREVAAELDCKMHDKDWLKEAGQAARQLAEECFDRDKLADQLIQVLQAAKNQHPEQASQIAPGNY